MINKYRVLIFGASASGEMMLDMLDSNKVSVIGFIDNNLSKEGSTIREVKIYKPDDIKLFDFDKIVIASSGLNDIAKQLKSIGVKRYKIVKIYKINPLQSLGLCREIFIRLVYKKRVYKELLLSSKLNQINRNYSFLNILLRTMLPRGHN